MLKSIYQFDLLNQGIAEIVYHLGHPINLGAGQLTGLWATNVEMKHDAIRYNQKVVSDYIGAFITVVCDRLNERRRTFGNWVEEHSFEIRMGTSKEDLLDWLEDVSDDAEIGIEIGSFGQLALMAKIPGDVRLIEIGDIPYPAEKEMLDEQREEMMKRLQQMDQTCAASTALAACAPISKTSGNVSSPFSMTQRNVCPSMNSVAIN